MSIHDPAPRITLVPVNAPSSTFTLSNADLTTILDALSHARTHVRTDVRERALTLEVNLIDWADNTGIGA